MNYDGGRRGRSVPTDASRSRAMVRLTKQRMLGRPISRSTHVSTRTNVSAESSWTSRPSRLNRCCPRDGPIGRRAAISTFVLSVASFALIRRTPTVVFVARCPMAIQRLGDARSFAILRARTRARSSKRVSGGCAWIKRSTTVGLVTVSRGRMASLRGLSCALLLVCRSDMVHGECVMTTAGLRSIPTSCRLMRLTTERAS